MVAGAGGSGEGGAVASTVMTISFVGVELWEYGVVDIEVTIRAGLRRTGNCLL